MVETEPEEEQGTQEGGLEYAIKHTRHPAVN